MKKLLILSILLTFTGYFVASERNVIYRLPDQHILSESFKKVGLDDFMQHSKLIESIQSHQIYPAEIGAFIQQAYWTYYNYLDSWSFAAPFELFALPFWDPVSTTAYFAIGGVYWNILRKMHNVISHREDIYRILLQEYPLELLRLKNLGILSSVSQSQQPVVPANPWTDPYGLMSDDEEDEQDEEDTVANTLESQERFGLGLYKIGSDTEEKYQFRVPTDEEIAEYNNFKSNEQINNIINYFINKKVDENTQRMLKDKYDDIYEAMTISNRLKMLKMFKLFEKDVIHPKEIGSFVEMIYAQEFENIYNFDFKEKSFEQILASIAQYIPLTAPLFASVKMMTIRSQWSSIENRHELYESLLRRYPSELVRLEQLGFYNSLHEAAQYIA